MQVQTRDALRITKASRSTWREAMDRGIYTCAPPASNSKREWALDDLVVLSWFDSLCVSGAQRSFAGKCAAGLRDAIRAAPDADFFHVYVIVHDDDRGELAFCTDPPTDPAAQPILSIDVGLWRRNVVKSVDDFYARRAGRHGSSSAPS